MKNVNVTISNVIAWFEESEKCMLHNHAEKMISTASEETQYIKVTDEFEKEVLQ